MCPSQYFGNMRPYADSNNVVERTICSCPESGFITAIVAQGEMIKTVSQTWYLVANGAVKSITKLKTVPSYLPGRLMNPETTSTNCMTASRSTHIFPFLPGQRWTGSSWDINFRLQEFTTTLSTIARVNHGAIIASMSPSGDGVVLSLGCSSLLISSSGTVAFVTAATLRTAISTNCALPTSPCDIPVLRDFDWNNRIDEVDCGNGIKCGPGHTCMSSAVGAVGRAGYEVTLFRDLQLS